ncbi:MAG: restriction endonuclease subunit S domain-containing protein [Acidimicrobiales bacterium]
MIPRAALDEVAEVQVGTALDARDNIDSETLLEPLRLLGLREFSYQDRVVPRYATIPPNGPPPVIVSRGDVVVALTGQRVGEAMIVGRRFDGSVIARDCARVRVKANSGVTAQWLHAWMRTQDYRGQVEREVVGGSIRRLTPKALRRLMVPIISTTEQHDFAELATAFDAALDEAKRAVSELETLRDKELDLRLYMSLNSGSPSTGSVRINRGGLALQRPRPKIAPKKLDPEAAARAEENHRRRPRERRTPLPEEGGQTS